MRGFSAAAAAEASPNIEAAHNSSRTELILRTRRMGAPEIKLIHTPQVAASVRCFKKPEKVLKVVSKDTHQ
jgi:hypothetical protein